MRISVLVFVMLIGASNAYAGWERQQDIPNVTFGYITENYYNYNTDRTVALAIYRGNVQYEYPEETSDAKRDEGKRRISSGSLITVAIKNTNENWVTSRRSQYGTIKIDGSSHDIEFLVNGAKAMATIVAEDGVNGDANSQQLARAIFKANKVSIDASSIGGKQYSFSR